MEILEKGLEMLQKIPKYYYLPIGVGCIGLILFVYGIDATLFQNQSREKKQLSNFSQDEPSGSSVQLATKNNIVIDVEGAVTNPGIYHVNTIARVKDALIAAGGLSEDADRQWVAHMSI